MLEADNQAANAAAEPSEVEWQLDAEDLDAVERWLATLEPHGGLVSRETGRKQIVDHYIDTADLRLYSAGYAARLRGANGKSEATLKSVLSAGDADSGLRRRLELNEPIRYALLHCLTGARGPVGTRIRQHAAVRELRVLFTVRTDRRTAIVSTPEGVDLGEVALDDTVIESAGRTRTLRRVEVEALIPDAERALAPFVEELRRAHGLRPGTSSKFGGGLDLAVETGVIEGVLPTPHAPTEDAVVRVATADTTVPNPPGRPTTKTITPLPAGSLAALVRDVVATQLALVRENEAGTRAGEDIEALHDMRVAVRRLRTALRLFAKLLPAVRASSGAESTPVDSTTAGIDASLRWLAAELGVVRDLDVQLERIEAWQQELAGEDAGALEPLADLLHDRRTVARTELVAALDTPRLAALYASLEALVAAGREELPKRALRPAVATLPGILRRQYRPFRSRVQRIEGDPEPSAQLLHETRIRAKRLRYAAEFSSSVYGKRARSLVSALKRAQDVLGLHQDAEFAIADLRRLANDAADQLPPQTLFTMGEVAQRYRESQQAQRRAFTHASADVRRRWRRLAVLIDERREGG